MTSLHKLDLITVGGHPIGIMLDDFRITENNKEFGHHSVARTWAVPRTNIIIGLGLAVAIHNKRLAREAFLSKVMPNWREATGPSKAIIKHIAAAFDAGWEGRVL